MKGMKRSKALGLVLTFSALFLLSAFQTHAAENANLPDIDGNQKCSLEIKMSYLDDNGKSQVIKGIELNIYRVAALQVTNGTAEYQPVAPFEIVPVDYTDMVSQSESGKSAKLLNQIQNKGQIIKSITGQDGKANFENLTLGMYLVAQAEKENGFSSMDPFLISVPAVVESDGRAVWNYQVAAEPKSEISKTPVKPETPKSKPQKSVPEKPMISGIKTGDAISLQFIVTLMAVGFLGIACITAIKIRKIRMSKS